MPKCAPDCTCAHRLQTAMLLLGVSRSKLYQLMNAHELAYVDMGHGRRIKHDVIKNYLAERTVC